MWVFRSEALAGPGRVAVGEGEVAVQFEVGAESLRRLVGQEVRGFACDATRGLLPSFTPVRVCGLRDEGKWARVKLMEVRSARDGLECGAWVSVAGVGCVGSAGEAESLYRWSGMGEGEGEGQKAFEEEVERCRGVRCLTLRNDIVEGRVCRLTRGQRVHGTGKPLRWETRGRCRTWV